MSVSVVKSLYLAEALMEEMGAEAGMFLSAPTPNFPLSLITDIKENTVQVPGPTAAVQK